MIDFKCRECGKDFSSRKSLHAHLKAHNLFLGEYYVKNFEKRDLLTGELLKFKNFDQYFTEDFNQPENYISWVKVTSPQKAKKHLKEHSTRVFEGRGLKYAPPNLYYKLFKLPDIKYYKKLWGSYFNFSKEMDLKPWFDKNLPKGFWEEDCSQLPIFIDTREKKPIHFGVGESNKLDFGDYTAKGSYYSKTFVDRKSLSDFKLTFGKGIDRFRREMDRCVEFDSYMFVVVEDSVEGIIEENKTSKYKTNLGYLWHNVRGLLVDYPENIQFVFAYSRKGVKKIIPKILKHGQSLWHVDVQYHLEEKANGLGKRKATV